MLIRSQMQVQTSDPRYTITVTVLATIIFRSTSVIVVRLRVDSLLFHFCMSYSPSRHEQVS